MSIPFRQFQLIINLSIMTILSGSIMSMEIEYIELEGEDNKTLSDLDSTYVMPLDLDAELHDLEKKNIEKCRNFARHVLHAGNPILISIAQHFYNMMLHFSDEKEVASVYKKAFYGFRKISKKFYYASCNVRVNDHQTFQEWMADTLNPQGEWDFAMRKKAWNIQLNRLNTPSLFKREKLEEEMIEFALDQSILKKNLKKAIQFSKKHHINIRKNQIINHKMNIDSREKKSDRWPGRSLCFWLSASMGLSYACIVVMATTPVLTESLVTKFLYSPINGTYNNFYKILPENIIYIQSGSFWKQYNSDNQGVLYKKYACASDTQESMWWHVSKEFFHTTARAYLPDLGSFYTPSDGPQGPTAPLGRPLFKEYRSPNIVGIVLPSLSLAFQGILTIFSVCMNACNREAAPMYMDRQIDIKSNKVILISDDPVLQDLQETLALWDVHYPTAWEMRNMIHKLYTAEKTALFQQTTHFLNFLNIAYLYRLCPTIRFGSSWKKLLTMIPDDFKPRSFGKPFHLWIALNKDRALTVAYLLTTVSSWLGLSFYARKHYAAQVMRWSSPEKLPENEPFFPHCPKNFTALTNQALSSSDFQPYTGAGVIYVKSMDSVLGQRFETIYQDPVGCNLMNGYEQQIRRVKSIDTVHFSWAGSFAYGASIVQFTSIGIMLGYAILFSILGCY